MTIKNVLLKAQWSRTLILLYCVLVILVVSPVGLTEAQRLAFRRGYVEG